MKKYTWAAGIAVIGTVLAGFGARWQIGEMLSGTLWGAVLGFFIGLVADLEAEIKGKK
jgi:hypothetical protein